MAGTVILKEFIIKLGFRVDEGQLRRFTESLSTIGTRAADLTKGFAKIAETSGLAMTAMGAAMVATGKQLEGLYFAAQRTGASAGELKEFAFAASQIGVSAEQAQSAIEGLAAARRTNPGLNGLIPGLDKTDNAKALLQLLIKLRDKPFYQGAQVAQMFGIDPQTFKMLEDGLPQMQKFLLMRERMFRAAGVSPEAMAGRGHEFMNQFRTLEASLGTLADVVAYRLMPYGEKVIGWLESFVGWALKADKATDGWSSKILGVVSALAGGSIVKGGLGLLGRVLGRGAAGAAVGEGAAAAGAAEGGAGLLSLISLPAVIVAAVAAALVWMAVHPEQVRKAAGAVWDWTKKTASTIGSDAKSGAAAIKEGAKASGGWVNMFAMQGGPLGDLAALVSKFEGFSKKVYADAGHFSWGFGHQVKPGEDLSHADPISVFMSDLKNSLSVVARNVKVRLTNNQRKALADLEYNIGEGAFKDSTLLRMLNQGRTDEAAQQFARWNKVLVDGHKVANETLSQRRASEAQLFRTPDGKTLNLQTSITIEGGGNARETARETANEQNRVYGNIVRNFTPAHQ